MATLKVTGDDGKDRLRIDSPSRSHHNKAGETQ